MLFSANLGFLWPDLPLPDAIRAAKAARFGAVECHWPYDTPAAGVRQALAETGLTMIGLNTSAGDGGTFGLTALPTRVSEARAAIDQALDYAAQINASCVHVMAGCTPSPDADATFRANLRYACGKAAPLGITILIEPINNIDVPGYVLRTTAQAQGIIADLSLPNLRLMFDCYHAQMSGEDVVTRLAELLPILGHIQFADVPGRGAPGTGDMDFHAIFQQIRVLGWDNPLGAEYKPGGPTADSLGWMARYT